MTSQSKQDAGNKGSGEEAGQDQRNQRPRDWRRRRRSDRPASAADGQAAAAQARSEDADEVLSQPLINFFDPAFDQVIIHSGPPIFAGIIALVTGIVVVAFISSMRLYGYIDIVIGLLLLGGVGAVLFSNVLTAFVSRTGRYGANTLLLVVAFTGIIVVANVVSFENHSRMDVTATNQFSLGNRTKDVLSNLS